MTARRKPTQTRCARCGYPLDPAALKEPCPECGLIATPAPPPPEWNAWKTALLLIWPFVCTAALTAAATIVARGGPEQWQGMDLFCGGFFFGYFIAPVNTAVIVGIRTAQVANRRESRKWGGRWVVIVLALVATAIMSTVLCFGPYLFATLSQPAPS